MVDMDGLAMMSSVVDVYRRLGLDSDQYVNAVGSLVACTCTGINR